MTGGNVHVKTAPAVCPDNLPLRFGSSYDAAVVYDAAADELTLQTKDGAGSLVDRIAVRAGTNSPVAVFNDPGADMDVRMEGDTDPNLLFLDASADRVGVGSAAPPHKLTVGAFESPTQQGRLGIKAAAAAGGFDSNIHMEEASGQESFAIGVDANRDLNFHNSGGAMPVLKVEDSSNAVFIGDTANTNMPGPGLTINQGAADNEILTIRSSDVAHGMTSITATNTYAWMQKNHVTTGGVLLAGLSSSAGSPTLTLAGFGTTDDTTKSAAANAYVTIQASKKSGASHSDPGANANIFLIEDGNSGNAKFIVDQEGDTWQGGGATLTTLTASGAISGTTITGSGAITGSTTLAVGSNPAASGVIRMPQNAYALQFRNAANSADMKFAGMDSSNNVNLFAGTNFLRVYNAAETVELLHLDSGGKMVMNDSSGNARMTTGITINQGAADDQILSLKSSDVATGLYTVPTAGVNGVAVETDDFLAVNKASATLGGVTFNAMAENSLNNALCFNVFGGLGDTSKTTSSIGAVSFFASSHNGSDGFANMAINANLFVISGRYGSSPTRFIVDNEGDVYADGSGVTVYDEHDDVALVRAFDLARATVNGGKGVVKTEWDRFVRYNEADLVRLGILGAPLSEGGLTCVTRLQQLHNGAIWQLGKRLMEAEERLGLAEQKLAALPALTGEPGTGFITAATGRRE